MQGFFSDAEVGMGNDPGTRRCAKCGLYAQCRSPRMEATGQGERGILVVAEAPGAEEDRSGVQLVGKAGQLLRKALRKNGIDLDRDCRKLNSVNCRPPNNRTPNGKEIDACRAMLWDEIREHPPQVILLLGGVAMDSFLGHRWHRTLGGITRWRGWRIPDCTAHAWVCPTYHPSFILRATTSEVAARVWEQDIANALTKLGEVPPLGSLVVPSLDSWREQVTLLAQESAVRLYLATVQQKSRRGYLAFDFETTGLKPHANGHEIVSCAISTDGISATAFQVTAGVMQPLAALLADARVRKIAANMKFEDAWSRELLGTAVAGWHWDTVLAAHVLDNRTGIGSVKFQTYVRFGIPDYDSHLAPLLHASEDSNANALNRIHEVPVDDLLTYNGLDALFEYRLAMVQKKEMRDASVLSG